LYPNGLSIEDSRCTLSSYPNLIDIDDLIREMDNAKVDIAVLLAVDVDTEIFDENIVKDRILRDLMRLFIVDAPNVIDGMMKILQTVKTDQKHVAEFVNSHPDRFIGFGSVNPSKNNYYIEKKLKELNNLDLAGVKLIPTLQFFHPKKIQKRLRRIFKFCSDTSRMLLIHTGCDPHVWEQPHFSENANPKYLERMIREFRDLHVILAYMGSYSLRYPGIWMDEALKLGMRYENVFFDVAAVTYTLNKREFVEKIENSVGFDRILFGSDYPVVQGSDMKSSIEEVLNSPHLKKGEKHKILCKNALRLLKKRR
jgi:predicted TIM-barrel fold metal-dependent hydrolase